MEYCTISSTGVGSILGLTEMGEIKQQLAKEAAADEALHGGDESSSLMNDIFGLFVSTTHAQEAWQDEITFTLAPGASTEIKATMEEGATMKYTWSATGGRINFDVHAHAGGEEVTYERGRGQTSGEGSFETPFAGTTAGSGGTAAMPTSQSRCNCAATTARSFVASDATM